MNIPYGYRITHGKAIVNQEEAKKLRKFYILCLKGEPVETDLSFIVGKMR